jgi:hypothetical protein
LYGGRGTLPEQRYPGGYALSRPREQGTSVHKKNNGYYSRTTTKIFLRCFKLEALCWSLCQGGQEVIKKDGLRWCINGTKSMEVIFDP